MTWLVFAISGLLVLVGAVSVSSGAPYIQLERGWTEVISGTVAVSSGSVVFALGVILMRLEALRDTMAKTPATPVPAFEPFTAAPPQASPPTPVAAAVDTTLFPEPREETVDVPTPEPAAEAADPPGNQGLWKRIRRPAETAEVARLEAGGFPDRIAAEPQIEAPALAYAALDPVVERPPAPPLAAVPSSEPPAEEPGQLGWLDRSLSKNRPPRVEPDLHGLIGEPARMPGEPADEGHAAEPVPLAVPADEGPTVIGRYQAGVASYVMYSDGTIEVETESGESHRFDSMDELKAFIAKQDGANR